MKNSEFAESGKNPCRTWRVAQIVAILIAERAIQVVLVVGVRRCKFLHAGLISQFVRIEHPIECRKPREKRKVGLVKRRECRTNSLLNLCWRENPRFYVQVSAEGQLECCQQRKF